MSEPIPTPEPHSPQALHGFASHLIDNPAVLKAFAEVELELMRKMAATPSASPDQRDDYHRQIISLRSVWGQLERLRNAAKQQALHERKLKVA